MRLLYTWTANCAISVYVAQNATAPLSELQVRCWSHLRAEEVILCVIDGEFPEY